MARVSGRGRSWLTGRPKCRYGEVVERQFFFCLFGLTEAQFLNNLLCFQSELDSVNSLLTEAEGNNIKSSKDISSLESQLQDSQVCSVFKPCSSSHLLHTPAFHAKAIICI